jgi:hypothetical protein
MAPRLRPSWSLRYVLLCFVLFGSSHPLHAQGICQTALGQDGNCYECQCVGFCTCDVQLYVDQCQAGECMGGNCYVIRSWAVDGGQGNCRYVCCDTNEWDCAGCPGI